MGASELGFSTRAIHGGKIPDANKSVVAPMYQTATFRYDTVEEGARLGAETGPGYFYTRWGNPTTDLFEQKMALLEGGEAALATSSGMAAIATAVMSLLRAGDHVVAPKAVYQATFGLFDSVLPGYGVEATFLDASVTHADTLDAVVFDRVNCWLTVLVAELTATMTSVEGPL